MYKCSLERMSDKVKTFSQFGDAGHGGITRYSLSKEANMARAEFKKLEDGDEENLALWKWFVSVSLNEYQKTYKQLGIDPMTKQAVFSNGLDIARAIEIHRYCEGKIVDSYGVGTFLTCDVTGCSPMNIVLKLVRGRITESREWHPCVKLSCDKGKTLGDKQKCDYLVSVLNG